MECKNDIDIPEMATTVGVKEEPYFLNIPTEMECESEEINVPEVYIKCELPSSATGLATEFGIHDDNNDGNAKLEIKKELSSFELKSELEVNCKSDTHIMSDLTSHASDFMAQSESGNDQEIDTKVDIKEEAVCVETMPTELNKDNTTEEDEEFILPDSTRLHTPTMSNYEHAVSSTGLNKSCLKPRENSSPCQGNSNTNATHGGNVTYILHLNNKISHICKFCGKCFSTAFSLQCHIVTHEGKGPFYCISCHKSFNKASNLKRHNLIHEGIRPFKCDKCDKSFTTRSNLKTHSVIHEGKRQQYKCNICEKSYVAEGTLKAHMLSHEGKHLYKCEKCEKSCTTASSLKRHQFIHGDKSEQHKCDICDKSFAIASLLRAHSFTHGGEKPYKCSQCDKAYIQPIRLKVHLLTHKDKKALKCNRCDKGYSNAANLERHSLIHKGGRHFKCNTCKR